MSSSGHDDEPSPVRRNRSLVGGGGTGGGSAKRVKKKRVRNFTADDRAAHRIFEKSRREAFKEALTNLAGLLPSLAETEPQRLSKHVVVDESISLINSQKDQIRVTSEHLQSVKRERDNLLDEVNQWRIRAGMELRQTESSPLATSHPAVQQPPQPQQQQQQHVEAAAVAVTSGGTPIAPAPPPADPTPSPVAIVGEASSPYIATPLHAQNMPPPMRSSSVGSAAEMPWPTYESRIQLYNTAGNNGGAPAPSPPSSYHPEAAHQFGGLDGRTQQEQPVFMQFDAQQPAQSQAYSPVGFASNGFGPNPIPLQNYLPS
ncbi:hypothetical protein F5Y16DRAFT_240548 [Xylariaceae sp. FL0255]|nr:hypothetical protein F5Y16DRAFT_240548 [Xylariaceae sp. FL0255]